MYRPTFEEFRQLAGQGNLIPVYREMLADMETPLSIYRKIDRGRYSFLLESMEGGEKWGRYSFMGLNPAVIVRSRGDKLERIDADGSIHAETGDPVALLRKTLSAYKPVTVAGLPRFFGGAVGYLGYDIVRFIEDLPETNPDVLGFYDMVLAVCNQIIIYDTFNQSVKIISNVFLQGNTDLRSQYEQATGEIDRLVQDLSTRLPDNPIPNAKMNSNGVSVQSNMTPDEFKAIVGRAKEYIRAGDIIQAVLAQRFESAWDGDPFLVYRALRRINPSPYLFYLRFDDEFLIGSSPEVLVRLENRKIEVRPIAGTRPRGRDEMEDRALEEELLSDPKERAEHIMLVDLGRNDVGRVARFGSVEVNELMVTERYSHVMHIVSNVRGDLEENKDAFDVFAATFPAGTVSGAPKIRAMEIIEELEPDRRGPYAGAVGYFSFSGNMDLCIAIRTLLIKNGKISIQAGAGIVADSDPEKEYQETLNKARGMIRAIEWAVKGLE
ncbi:MAG: anthranilate synthase component I [Pseudomonadota bacterium]